jgi:hypothetical protein
MMGWQNRWVVATFVVIASAVSARTSLGQYGIWTSQDRHLSYGDASVPTPFGLSHGATMSLSALTTFDAAPDFGDWVCPTGSYGDYRHGSRFTENSLILDFAYVRFFGVGNLYYSGQNYAHHVEATFHLDARSPYWFGAVTGGMPFALVSGHYPTLSGPGGQVLTLSAEQEGNLAAGDWQFLFDLQAVFPTDNYATIFDTRVASFQLVIPEPASLTLFAVLGTLFLVRRNGVG